MINAGSRRSPRKLGSRVARDDRYLMIIRRAKAWRFHS